MLSSVRKEPATCILVSRVRHEQATIIRHERRSMSLTRWVAVLAPAVAAILLPVPALASNALQSSAPSARVVSHQSETVTMPRVTCDQLIRVHHLPAATPCWLRRFRPTLFVGEF